MEDSESLIFSNIRAQTSVQLIGTSRAFDYLHSRDPPCIHGDLHPVRLSPPAPAATHSYQLQNQILLDNVDEPLVADYGFSRILYEPSRSMTRALSGGKPAYLAPEITDGEAERPTTSSDIYALGMTFYAILSRQEPFPAIRSPWAQMKAARNKQRPEQIPFPWFTIDQNDRLWGLLRGMWDHSGAKRPDAREVLEVLVDIRSHK